MAIYPYRCDKCSRDLEVMQSPQEAHEATCPSCGDRCRRVYTTFGISVDFRDGLDVGAGRHFNTKRERENFLSQSNLRRVKT